MKSDRDKVPGTVSEGVIIRLGFVSVRVRGEVAWPPFVMVTFVEGAVGSDGPYIGVYSTEMEKSSGALTACYPPMFRLIPAEPEE